MTVYSHLTPSFTSPKFLSADSSLKIPLTLTLSEIKLSGIIILVFSKAKGATLVFRNDPLESIKISSTFDSIPPIARLIQTQIEEQIRLLFREDLPGIIHKLSQRWTSTGSTESSSCSASSSSSKYLAQSPEKATSPRLKPITLAEINPDLPVLNPINMVKINVLAASQRTLSLFTPPIHDAIYRSMIERHNEFEDESRDDDDMSSIIIRSRRNLKIAKGKRQRKVFNLRKSE